MVYTQTRISPSVWDVKNPLDFGIQRDHLISVRRPDIGMVNKKKKKRRKNQLNSELCRQSRPQSEIRENETSDKYLDLARELKEL